jgi:glycerol-3-phosphate dehydrogenase
MATTLADVLTRRTRAHLRDRAACRAAAADVADLLAPERGWDAAETARQVADYRAMCDAEVAAAATTAGSSA